MVGGIVGLDASDQQMRAHKYFRNGVGEMSMMMTIRIFHGVTKTGNKLGSIRTAYRFVYCLPDGAFSKVGMFSE